MSRSFAKRSLCSFCRVNVFARERLRRVLRTKTSAELRLIYIFTSSPLHIHWLCSCSHPHNYVSSTSLLMFTSAHLHLCSCSHLYIYISTHLHILASTSDIFTSRSSLFSLLRPGAVPPEHHETQPSAEIVRVEGAKLDLARAGVEGAKCR